MQRRQHTQDEIPQALSQSQEVCVKSVFCPQLCTISMQKTLLKILERITGQKLEDRQSTEKFMQMILLSTVIRIF